MKAHGGSDDQSNLVYLTARSHYLAHFLLWKLHRDKATAFSFHNMTITSYDRLRVYSSRYYKSCREDMALGFSKENPMYNPEIVAKISGDNHFMKNPEVQKRYSESRTGAGNPCFGKRGPRCSRVMTPLGEFSSILLAAKHFKIDPNTVYRRLKDSPDQWHRIQT